MTKHERNQRSRILRLLRLREVKWRKRLSVGGFTPLPEPYVPVRRIRHHASARAKSRDRGLSR